MFRHEMTQVQSTYGGGENQLFESEGYAPAPPLTK